MKPAVFHWKRLEQAAADLLVRAGVGSEHASLVAESLVHADLRGIESHGLSRLPIYVRRIEAGLIELSKEPVVMKQDGATALLDGQNQLGAVVGMAALAEAMRLSQQLGIGVAGVRHSNHFGSCSYYAEKAMAAGLILIVLSNAPEAMAPTGGIRPFLGTNPIAIGIPAGEEPAFLLDMATSVSARGKIALAAKKGDCIPDDWAIDRFGQATTDPKQALLGSLLPIGGAKGYGLAMFVDILCGVLAGAAFGPQINSLYEDWEHPQNIGHLFLTMDIQRFMSVPVFYATMDQYIREIKSVPTREGVREILIPGEIELRKQCERKRNGIPFDAALAEELRQLFDAYGIDLTTTYHTG